MRVVGLDASRVDRGSRSVLNNLFGRRAEKQGVWFLAFESYPQRK